MKLETISLEEMKARDLRGTAIHESSHAIVASRYVTRMEIDITLNPNWKDIHERMVVGQLRRTLVASNMGRSAIGWAGIIGEAIDEDKDLDFDGFLEDFYACCLELSPTDQASIEATPFRHRAARMAFNTLTKRWREVTTLAESLIDTFKRTGIAAGYWSQKEGWKILSERLAA